MMNMPGMQQPVMGQVMVPTAPPVQPQQQQEVLDNITKVKGLIGPLKHTLELTLKTAAHNLHQNSFIDIGTVKSSIEMSNSSPRFDKHMEEFYSLCDQIELHLQGKSSSRYMNLNVAPREPTTMPTDMPTLSYPQYLSTVRTQVGFAKELHDMLVGAAQSVTPD